MTIWTALSGLNGRISRLMFWKFQLQAVLIEILLGVGIVVLAINEIVPRPVLFALAGLVLALYLWTGFIFGLKRLHDIDKSASYLWLFVVAPAVLGVLAHFSGFSVLGIPASLLEIWGLIEMGLQRGKRGPNRFGADPFDDRDAPASAR